jgi:HSP20 family protein
VIKNRFLRVSGEKKDEYDKKGDSDKKYVERTFGKFVRTFQLPKNTRVDEIKAVFENGVLRIVVPLPPDAVKESKKIEIRSKL